MRNIRVGKVLNKPRKMEQYEKIWLYPELTVYCSHLYNNLQVMMRSPKILVPEEDGAYRVTRIQGFRNTQIYDSAYIYDTTKKMIQIVADEYYDYLLKTEIYYVPENVDLDLFTQIIVDGEKE